MLCAPANTPHTSTGSGFTAPAALPAGLPTHKQLPKGTRHQEKHSGASCSLQDMTSELRSDGEQGYFGLPNVLKPKSNDCRFKKAVCVPLKFLFGSNKNSYVKKPFCPEAPFNHIPMKSRKPGSAGKQWSHHSWKYSKIKYTWNFTIWLIGHGGIGSKAGLDSLAGLFLMIL